MPNPKPKETEKEFLKRCIPELINEGRKVKQAAAICYSIYRREGTEKSSPKKISGNKQIFGRNRKLSSRTITLLLML